MAAPAPSRPGKKKNGYLPVRYRKRTAGLKAEHGDLSEAGPYHIVGLETHSVDEVISTIKDGLPVDVFDRLQEQLDVPARTLADIVQIAERTLNRRRKQGCLSVDESERVLRIARLFDQAVHVLGNVERARQWFKTPLPVLGGKTPLQYADTEPGAREVEDVLGRIAYGVFS